MKQLLLAITTMVILGGCAMMQPLPPLDAEVETDTGNGATKVEARAEVTERGVLWIPQCGQGGVFGLLHALLGGCPPSTPCDHGDRFCCLNPGHPRCGQQQVAGRQSARPRVHPQYRPEYNGPPTTGFGRLRHGDENVGYYGTVNCDSYQGCHELDTACRARKAQCEAARRVADDERSLRRRAVDQFEEQVRDWSYCCGGGVDRSRCAPDMDCSQPPQFYSEE